MGVDKLAKRVEEDMKAMALALGDGQVRAYKKKRLVCFFKKEERDQSKPKKDPGPQCGHRRHESRELFSSRGEGEQRN